MRSEFSNQFLQFFNANPVLIPGAYIAGALIIATIVIRVCAPARY